MKTVRTILISVLLLPVLAACEDEKFISESQLPQRSRDFLATHFPGTAVEYVIKEWNEYDVHLANGFQTGFDRKGEWDDVDGINQPVPQSIIDLIPASVPEYVSSHFPNASIVEINRETFGYEIELSNGIDLEFNSRGGIRDIDD
jgi:hypothetical protein